MGVLMYRVSRRRNANKNKLFSFFIVYSKSDKLINIYLLAGPDRMIG